MSEYYYPTQQRRSSSGCCGCSPCCLFLITLLVVGGVIVGLGQNGKLEWWPEEGFSFPTFEDFIDEAPFNATSPEDAPFWPNNGRGLELEILFAAEEKWRTYFDQAVADWENGTPDTLTLTSTYLARDLDCRPIPGKLKFCNDDYGETGWRGLNVAIIQGRVIQNSVAKMNEYYLGIARDPEKQCKFFGSRACCTFPILNVTSLTIIRADTACHELGHGYGLPHTDETFWNRPQGNCMDYTNDFRANMQPDIVNYEFLAELYGTVDGVSAGQSVSIESQGDARPPGDEVEKQEESKSNNDRRQLLRKQTPSQVLRIYDDLMNRLEGPKHRHLSTRPLRIHVTEDWEIHVNFLPA